jgi:hypothetical protein
LNRITIPRSDLANEEVAVALRHGLGPRYHVLAGLGIRPEPDNAPELDQPDLILVGIGSDRVFRAEVAITRGSGQTIIEVRPGGLPNTWPGGVRFINRVWIARKVHHVLDAASDLR